MAETIRATYKNGKFEPSDEVSLLEGAEVILSITPTTKSENDFERAAGAWKDTVDCDQLIQDVYTSRLLETREEPKL